MIKLCENEIVNLNFDRSINIMYDIFKNISYIVSFNNQKSNLI